MKKFFVAMLLGFMLLCGQNVFNPAQAEAAEVEINNQIGKPLSVAVIYFSENANKWLVKGWYSVPANSFRTLTFSDHCKNNFWIHMHNKDRSWGQERAWTVIKEPFTYEAGKSCPEGSNRRQVAFDKYPIGQDGSVRVTARNY